MRRPALPCIALAAHLVCSCAADPPPGPATSELPPQFAVAPRWPSVSPPPRRPRTPVPQFTVEDNTLKLPGPVVFETNSDKLSPVSDEVLQIVHDYLDAKPEITLLRIEGHMDTDDMDRSGHRFDSQILSEKRALAVTHWLVDHGIACERLLAVGFGTTKPIAPNDTPDNKAQNRRITFVNAELNGHLVGPGPFRALGGGRPAGVPCH